MLCPSNPKWKVSVFLWAITHISLHTWAHTKNLADWQTVLLSSPVVPPPALSSSSIHQTPSEPHLDTWAPNHCQSKQQSSGLATVCPPGTSRLVWKLGWWFSHQPGFPIRHLGVALVCVLETQHLFLSAPALLLDPDSWICIPLSCLLSQLVPAAKQTPWFCFSLLCLKPPSCRMDLVTLSWVFPLPALTDLSLC